MEDFWSRCIQRPIELQFNILNQVAGNLDMARICGMVLRTNVIMLQKTSSVEIMNEWVTGLIRGVCCVFDGVVEDVVLEIGASVEILVDGVDLRHKAGVVGSNS